MKMPPDPAAVMAEAKAADEWMQERLDEMWAEDDGRIDEAREEGRGANPDDAQREVDILVTGLDRIIVVCGLADHNELREAVWNTKVELISCLDRLTPPPLDAAEVIGALLDTLTPEARVKATKGTSWT